MKFTIWLLLLYPCTIYTYFIKDSDTSDNVFDVIVDIIDLHLKRNGWNNMLYIGRLPDRFYYNIQHIPFTSAITNIEYQDHHVADAVPYPSNIIVIKCSNFKDLELILRKVTKTMPYWHPHSNIIIYYDKAETKLNIAKIFFLLWYHKALNVIIIQKNTEDSVSISYFSPYVYKHFKMDNVFGCWTNRKLDRIIKSFEKELICTEGCQNVTINSNLRTNNLGTCLGFNTIRVANSDHKTIKEYDLFEDKAKNFHGYTFTAYATEVLPFLTITGNDEGSYSLGARDGLIWNTVAELMNFTIDLTPSYELMKKPFHFELVIRQLIAFTLRKGDLFIIPVYQFELVFIEIDHTFPTKGGGVCLLAHRADFETILFDIKRLQDSFGLIIRFLACFLCIWMVFCIFSFAETGRITFDQTGRALLNTVRNVLLINLHRPPEKQAFRIFLAVSLWSFFVLSFATQASIVSFFTAIKRGKEVDTFEDVIEKGYPIEGMASPDIILPNDEEKYRKINSLVAPAQDLYACVKQMSNDSRRFCLLDCSVCRYLERNRLNEKGEQFLHVLKDRIHSNYLNMVLPKQSPLTETFSRHIMTLFEAGLVVKWEQYRFNDMKADATVTALGMGDFIGIYKAYGLSLGFIFVVFLLELLLGNMNRFEILRKCTLERWRTRRVAVFNGHPTPFVNQIS